MRHEEVGRFPFWSNLAGRCRARGADGVVPRAGARRDNPQERGSRSCARASQLEDLLSPETGPFRLRAQIGEAFGLVDGTREGQYMLVAASPAQWLDATRFPGYSETNGLADGHRGGSATSSTSPTGSTR